MNAKKIIRKGTVTLLTALFAGVLIGGFIFVALASSHSESRMIDPSKTQVFFSGWESENFLKASDVLSLLPFNPKDSSLISVNTLEVESLLIRRSPYIRDVSAYISPAGKSLRIRISERRPIMTYFSQGKSFFLDEEGEMIRNLGKVGADVPLVLGDLSEKSAQEAVLSLVNYLNTSRKWKDFFGSIRIISDSKIHLYPRVGDFIFEIDGVEELGKKMEKIEIFYRKIIPKAGANKYQLIKLSYDNQIVCKYR